MGIQPLKAILIKTSQLFMGFFLVGNKIRKETANVDTIFPVKA